MAACKAAGPPSLRLLAAVWCILLVGRVAADFDTFPVKSKNLNQSNPVAFYESPSVAGYGLFDVHPVHGTATSDGGYVMVGKAVEADGSTIRRAFAVKLNATGSILWVWGSTAAGVDDVANAVVQLPRGSDGSGDDLLVVGYRTFGGVGQRAITKLSLASGSELWTALWPASNPSRHGAWEMAELTRDGTAVLLAGLTDSPIQVEAFKSYGNVGAGSALVQSLPVGVLASAVSAPVESAASWTYGPTTAYWTSKAARSLPDGSAVALLYREGAGKMASLVKLSAAGAVLWGPIDYGTQHGEGTDVVVAADGSGFAIAGHGDGGVAETLSGRLTKVGSDGTHAWSRSYSSVDYSLGNKLIKNECWGVQPLEDGYVMACGTGIEDCDGYAGQVLADCQAGRGDPRPGAVPRAASVWQSLIVRTDLDGGLLWQRVDQYRERGSPPLGTPGWTPLSSAAEYVVRTPADGGLTFFNDEVGGIGLLRLSAVNATNATDATDSTADVTGSRFTREASRSLPEFHPCAGALNGEAARRIRETLRYAGAYTSLVVVALSPRIGPVSGGVSIGVCGLGFPQSNEAVSHLGCRFTDGRNMVDVPAVYVDEHQLRCVAPDFTGFAVGMPHNVSVEVTATRGALWTNNRVPFTYYSTRPSIDAFGRPMWGYEPTFTKAAWQVTFEENDFGSFAPELYPPSGHPLNEGRPSPWDAPRDPFHAQGASAEWQPVELDVGDRMEPAEDLVVRTAQERLHGVEGSWGDRKSFLRAHAPVPDVYRKDVVAARAAMRELIKQTNNGVM